MAKALEYTANDDTPAGEPSSPGIAVAHAPKNSTNVNHSLFQKLRYVLRGKNDTSLREAIAEYIEESRNGDREQTSVTVHERALLSNILKLRDDRVVDVMIPRADIVAVPIDTSQADLLAILSKEQYSRIPVYRETLDDVVGTIHVKDILGCLINNKAMEIKNLLRDVPIVSPSMHILDLLLMMKQMKRHMALVVDEYGGIDGLVTVNDIIEAIVGDIEDEYDDDEEPQLEENKDGSILADGRLDIDDFENRYGSLLSAEEREEVDTLGGLVFFIAGRVPARGEILPHESGMVFEILDADPRRVKRLLIKNIPLRSGEVSP